MRSVISTDMLSNTRQSTGWLRYLCFLCSLFENTYIGIYPAMAHPCKAKITLDGNQIELEITDQTILETLLDAGYDPPYSCTSGVCTTCMAKLLKGKVEMEVNYGLAEDDVDEGYILTCQSHPTTDEIEVDYDY